jgi:iron complex outermembrane receptor protein
VSYKDSTHQFEIPNPLTDQEAFSLVDLSVVWASDSGRWELGLHGRNLTDEEYIAAAYDFFAVDQSVIGFYGPPRTVTATATINFDR